jgi:putative ABC transport system permease protein
VRDIGMESFRPVPVHYGKEQLEGIDLQGVTPNMAIIGSTQLAAGRFIAETDDQRRLNVTVIGNDLKQRFFPTVDAVGKTILVRGRPFEVIGVAKAKGSVFGQPQDDFLMVPIETYFKMYGFRSGIGYVARAIDQQHLYQAQDETRMLLRSYRHLGPKQEDNFGIAGSDTLVNAWNQLTGAIAATAVGVVSVFMVVGGVVIMNIMLAVVTERTHEIGIRKSVGARRRDILSQFLVESSMLAAIGGVIGVSLSYLVALLIRNLTPVPMAVPISAVIIGVALSATVGLFFGIYPASRAARLDPIEALRAER